MTSSIYLNLNISMTPSLNVRLRSSLFWYKQNDNDYNFVKSTFLCHFRSRRHDVIKLSIADISLIVRVNESQFGQRDEDSPCDFAVI